MATIVEMINPLTGLPEQVDKLDHTAQEIDDAVGLAPQLSNHNLLDNWYFGNPVNQRGVTSGEAGWTDYYLDRWMGYCKYELTNTGLKLEANSYLLQRLERTPIFPATLSVKLASGELFYATFTQGGTVNVPNYGTFGVIAASGDAPAYVYAINGSTVTVEAAKLELGSQQTLAHQDENGNWVLNEIPDYGEQLAKCQRHQLRVGYKEDSTYSPVLATGVAVSSASIRALIPTPVTMRNNPVISFFESDTISTIHAIGNGVSLTPTAIDARVNSNGIFLNLTVSGATVNETYAITFDHARGLMLDANL